MSEERRMQERRQAERRTMSLRVPGMGGLTPAQSMAATNPCLNCGTNVQLEYCPECGQRQIDPDPTLREFVHEALEQVAGWDGKLWSSFRLLVTRPGELTNEFLAGRRARYLSPVRLYLTASVLYFFALTVSPDLTPAKITVDSSRQASTVARGQAQGPRDGTDNRIQRGMAVAEREPKRFTALLTSALPTVIFVLVPLFALAMQVSYRRYRRRYPQHLTFAVHATAFSYVVSAAAALMGFAQNTTVGTVSVVVTTAALVWWVFSAARRVYGSRAFETIGRLIVASLIYGVGLLAATALLAIGSFYRLGSP